MRRADSWTRLVLGTCLAIGLAAASAAPVSAAALLEPPPLQLVEMQGEFGKNTKGFVCKVTYPLVVSTTRREAAEEISETLAEKAWEFAQNYAVQRSQKGTPNIANDLGYEVKCNNSRYLSLNLYTYFYAEHAAHPLYVKEGVTFDAATGTRLRWKDLVRPEDKEAFTLAGINQKLLTSRYAMEDAFFSDFRGLRKLPQNYYVDGQGFLHFQFAPYEIGPYSSGQIDLNTNCKAKGL